MELRFDPLAWEMFGKIDWEGVTFANLHDVYLSDMPLLSTWVLLFVAAVPAVFFIQISFKNASSVRAVIPRAKLLACPFLKSEECVYVWSEVRVGRGEVPEIGKTPAAFLEKGVVFFFSGYCKWY